MMSKMEQDDLDAFIWEAETISKQIKDIAEGRIDVDKLVEKEKAIRERKEKEGQKRKWKQEEETRKHQEELMNGRKGKGEGSEYEMFCQSCFIEYVLKEVTTCTHCTKKLISKEERHKILKEKVEILKNEKNKKKFRKMKYENWVKTEGILKVSSDRIGPTNYKKWDIYESDSDPDEKPEPILPKNDPNFMALEKQLKDDEIQREKQRQTAIRLKDEGNKMLNDGKYGKAAQLYTEAIESCRSMMILYTNRALAYIKQDKHEEAIVDCDKVIEYLEVFEEEQKKNKSIFIKAYSRKALCCLKLKRFTEAMDSVCVALAVESSNTPNDELDKLKELITKEREIYEKTLQEIEGDAEVFRTIDEQFDAFPATRSLDVTRIVECFKKGENYKMYFIKKGGLELIFANLEKFISLVSQFTKDEKYFLLVNNLNGYNKLIKLLFNDKITLNISDVASTMSVLEQASQNEQVRKSISSLKNFDLMFISGLKQYKFIELSKDQTSVRILNNLFTFFCNICYSSPNIRSLIANKDDEIITFIKVMMDNFKLEQSSHLDLFESVCSFLTNMSNDLTFRVKLSKKFNFLSFMIERILPMSIGNFTNENEDLFEKTIALLYNLSFCGENETDVINYYIKSGMTQSLDKFIKTKLTAKVMTKVRVLMITSRITKFNPTVFDAKFYSTIVGLLNAENLKSHPQIIDNGIKIIAHLIKSCDKFADYISVSELMANLNHIFIIDNQNVSDNSERIINSMSVMISIIGKFPDCSDKIKDSVASIIQIAKDKTDLLRKNAAILLAKLVRSSENMEAHVRQLHGMDVLLNVAKFIKL